MTEHETCATCGCIVGHGCPESEPCECEECDEYFTVAVHYRADERTDAVENVRRMQ